MIPLASAQSARVFEISYVFSSKSYEISICVNPPYSSVRSRDFYYGLMSVMLQENDSLVDGGRVVIGLM